MTSDHDPSEHIRGLQQILVSDKKRIAFLFGAGTSSNKNNDKNEETLVPVIKEMTQKIEENLLNEDKYKIAIEAIKKELGKKYNIETFLSNLEQKVSIISNGKLNGLSKKGFQKLIKNVKKEIRQQVSVHEDVEVENLIHCDFAEWVGRSNRKHAIEIFTTNYDYLLEIGLEGKDIPFYDGFTGSYIPFFNAASIEDMNFTSKQTKLWKIHGSLGWHYDDMADKVCRKDLGQDKDILIYPSMLKYNESKKQPYIALIDRLTNFLRQEDTVLITCGYAFGDEHINERILTALNDASSGHVIALFYDINASEERNSLTEHTLTKLAKKNSKLSVYGRRSAVIGGQLGQWKLKRKHDKEDISLYFEVDADCSSNDEKEEKKSAEDWTGKGELTIPNFLKFVEFLQSMMTVDESLKGDSQ